MAHSSLDALLPGGGDPRAGAPRRYAVVYDRYKPVLRHYPPIRDTSTSRSALRDRRHPLHVIGPESQHEHVDPEKAESRHEQTISAFIVAGPSGAASGMQCGYPQVAPPIDALTVLRN